MAKTCMACRIVASSVGVSPSARAMSTIERNMIAVVTGSSTASACGPRNPDTAPVVTAAALCKPGFAAEGPESRKVFAALNNTYSSASRVVSMTVSASAGGAAAESWF